MNAVDDNDDGTMRGGRIVRIIMKNMIVKELRK